MVAFQDILWGCFLFLNWTKMHLFDEKKITEEASGSQMSAHQPPCMSCTTQMLVQRAKRREFCTHV